MKKKLNTSKKYLVTLRWKNEEWANGKGPDRKALDDWVLWGLSAYVKSAGIDCKIKEVK
jgi:hypothetical protein